MRKGESDKFTLTAIFGIRKVIEMKSYSILLGIPIVALVLAVSGCQTGRKPDFAAADGVRVYGRAPGVYRELGVVEASHPGSITNPKKWNAAVAALKAQAAALGANGVIVAPLGDYQNASLAAAYTGDEGAYAPSKPSDFLRTRGNVLRGVAVRTL